MDNINLYNEDCFNIFPSIADKSIDMILCDLPYGTTQNKWDIVLPLDKLWAQYKRIIKPNGAIVLFSQMPFTATLASSNLSMLKYEWIWQKENGSGFLNANHAPLKLHENILVFSDGSTTHNGSPMTYNPQKTKGKPYTANRSGNSTCYGKQGEVTTVSNGDRFPVDIIKFNRDKDKHHPTQKPVALAEYLIKTYTNEGQTVLDNCMGAGTTGIACRNTNRHFIGIEKDTNYFNIATKRILNNQ